MGSFIETISRAMKEIKEKFASAPPSPVVKCPAGAGLKADTPNNPDGHVNWRYHVAPTVKVCGSDGKTRDMVMDPSLFGCPVTVDEWKKRQQDDKSKIEPTDDKPYFRGPGGSPMVEDKDGSRTKVKLADHTKKRDERKLSKGK